MALVVQKYGGSSMATADRIRNVARRAATTKERGNMVVAVVSAMGDTTDELIALARQITDDPDEREMDLLLHTGEIVSCTLLTMALRKLGLQAVSLTGAQAGIRTDGVFSKARIMNVNPERLIKELREDRIVIVAGFQGITLDMDITTLGRGGSDTTAVALASALGAQACEIYTDVDGVFTADPRICPKARKLEDVSYEEMLELAQYGARVMHSRAVELGEAYGMPILVASSFNENPGTLIHGGELMENRRKVRGIAHDSDVAKITVIGVPDQPGIAAAIFEPLADAHVSVDTIVQNASAEGTTDLSFTVSRGDLIKAMRLVEPVTKEIAARGCVFAEDLGKVSIVGSGMQNTPGYASKMFRALADTGVNIEMITTSEIRITCIIEATRVEDAVRTLHDAFQLETPE